MPDLEEGPIDMILKGLKAPFYVNPTKLKLPRLGMKDVKIDLLFDLETIKNVHISIY